MQLNTEMKPRGAARKHARAPHGKPRVVPAFQPLGSVAINCTAIIVYPAYP